MSLENELRKHAPAINNPETSWREFGKILKEIRTRFPELLLFEASIGIVEHQGKKLLLRRSQHLTSYPDTWGFPGGKRDRLPDGKKEPLSRNIIREVLEETGISTEITRKIGTRRSVLAEKRRIQIIHCFEMKALSDPTQVQLSPEHIAWKYCDSPDDCDTQLGPVTRDMLQWRAPHQLI